jgi:GcrA cell cycle regulator
MSAIPPTTWTPDRIDELKRLFEAEYTCSQIAREIGVTRNAVIGKLSRLGLARPGGPRGRRRQSSPRAARHSQVSILRTLHAKMEAAVAEEPIVEGQRCSLFDLSPQTCRWPIGRPGADDFGFCGSAPVEGLPYCAGHARMAYQQAARRCIN